MINEYSRFDNYSRTDGRRYFELEFAVINSGLGGPDENNYSGPNRLKYATLDAALAEAVFMEGMERNGDIVYGSAYAPGGGSTVVNQVSEGEECWRAKSADVVSLVAVDAKLDSLERSVGSQVGLLPHPAGLLPQPVDDSHDQRGHLDGANV